MLGRSVRCIRSLRLGWLLTLLVPCFCTPAGAADRWFTAHPAPTSNPILDIWGASSRDVFLVGYGGTIIHFDGLVWTAMESGTTVNLQAIWGSSETDVYAVGSGATILHYDGSTWHKQTSPVPDVPLWDVWVAPTGEAFAVGEGGVVLQKPAGGAWTLAEAVSDERLYCVWGTSASDVHAGGGPAGIGIGTLTDWLHYDGQHWSSVTRLTNGTPLDIWGVSPTEVYAVDNVGQFHHFDGSVWAMGLSGGRLRRMNAVFGFGRGQMFAVGQQGDITHHDGTRLQSIPSPSTEDLFGLWGESRNDLFAVGDHGTLLHFDGSQWIEISGPESADLYSVWVSERGKVYATVGTGEILRLDLTGVTLDRPPSASTLYGIWGASENDVLAAGSQGKIVHFDGVQWSAAGSHGNMIRDLWGLSPEAIFSGGTNGVGLFDGLQWTGIGPAAGPGQPITTIWASSTDRVFAAGYQGIAFRYDGQDWTEFGASVTGTQTTLNDLWGAPDSPDVFFAGGGFGITSSGACVGSGVLLRYDGVQWHNQTPNALLPPLHGVFGTSSTDVYAVGCRGAALHYDGDHWSEIPSGTVQDLFDLHGSTNGQFVAVGRYGTVLQRGDGSYRHRLALAQDGTAHVVVDAVRPELAGMTLDGGSNALGNVTISALQSPFLNLTGDARPVLPIVLANIGQASCTGNLLLTFPIPMNVTENEALKPIFRDPRSGLWAEMPVQSIDHQQRRLTARFSCNGGGITGARRAAQGDIAVALVDGETLYTPVSAPGSSGQLLLLVLVVWARSIVRNGSRTRS